MLAAQFCPICRGSNFYEHWMLEYRREWNKCGTCGYMELKRYSIERVINKLSPEKLKDPFVDPINEFVKVKRTKGKKK
jgi:predicted nucleic-acid-binding Zn-ribbon protein